MRERIIELRNVLKLNQTEFASKLNITRNFICLYEGGKRELSDRTILDICNTFSVNEEWLRNGVGDMFKPKDREEEIAELTKQMLKSESGDFRFQLQKLISELSEDDLKLLKRMAKTLYEAQLQAEKNEK